MKNLLTLPHSSATVERVFSSVNRMKTKLRNKLSTETLTGLLHTQRLMSKSDVHCYNLDVSEKMLSYFNKDIYD